MNHRTGGKLSLALLAVCTLLLLGAMAQALGFYHRMAYPLEYQALIEAAAAQYDLPPELLYAVTRTESSFNPQVESSVGARGLMQITRDTADWAEFRKGTGQDLDVAYDRLFEPEANIQCGAFILRLLIDEFGTVESLKTVSSLYMPAAGEVVERNEALEGKPTLVNLNCYADGWMLRIRPTETPALMTAADYRSQLEG